MKKRIKVIIGILISIFIIFEVYIFALPFFEPPVKSDVIVVLGCKLHGEVPSQFLIDRSKSGATLYKEGYANKIIVSGGKGDGEDISEALGMKRILMSEGVKEDDIILEDKSRNTTQNIKYSNVIMKENGFNDAIIVSNAFHLRRAKMLSKFNGINASFKGTFNTMSPKYTVHEIYGAIREIPAIIKDFIFR